MLVEMPIYSGGMNFYHAYKSSPLTAESASTNYFAHLMAAAGLRSSEAFQIGVHFVIDVALDVVS